MLDEREGRVADEEGSAGKTMVRIKGTDKNKVNVPDRSDFDSAIGRAGSKIKDERNGPSSL